jgi:hypothetical protein
MEIDIKKLSSRELSLVEYKARVRFINASHELRAAGRGDERPSEVRAQHDPISVEYTKSEQALLDIMDEKKRRMEDHGNLRPIKEQARA